MAERTTLGFDTGDRVFLYAAGLALGALAGALLPIAVHWAVDQGLPLPGWLAWLDTVEAGWLAWGRPLIGGVVGAGFAAAIIERSPVLTVSAEEIVVDRGSDRRRIARAEVAGVYRAGSKTVIETAAGRRLFEDEVEGGRDRVRQAFLDHGWPYESESR